MTINGPDYELAAKILTICAEVIHRECTEPMMRAMTVLVRAQTIARPELAEAIAADLKLAAMDLPKATAGRQLLEMLAAQALAQSNPATSAASGLSAADIREALLRRLRQGPEDEANPPKA